MSLVVEDGTGLSGAESYASVAEADAYHAKWSVAADLARWDALDTSAKETALRQASRWLASAYINRWPGRRLLSTQALEWPRFDAFDRAGFLISSTLVPAEVKDATSYVALAASAGDLSPMLERGGEIRSVSIADGNGKMTTSRTYSASAPTGRTAPKLEEILGRVLRVRGELVRG